MKTARNIVAGALSGLGVVILLQQYAVAYPTGMITIIGVIVGIAVQFGVAQIASRRTVGLAAAGVGSGGSDPAVVPLDGYESATWSPTHRVPASGLDAFEERDGTVPPVAHLDEGLEITVDEMSGDWARITCENGWTAWVDARRLEVGS
jgi:hypothetical protein